MKKGTQARDVPRETMRSVFSPPAYYQSRRTHPPILVKSETKRAHAHFLPLRRLSRYFLKPPSPPASTQPSAFARRLCAVVPQGESVMREPRLLSLISAWQSWLRFRYTEPHSLASAQKTTPLTLCQLTLHTGPNKPRRMEEEIGALACG